MMQLEASVSREDGFSLILVVCSKAIEPEVVLRQAYVDVKGHVFPAAPKQSLTNHSCSENAGLVIGIGF